MINISPKGQTNLWWWKSQSSFTGWGPHKRKGQGSRKGQKGIFWEDGNVLYLVCRVIRGVHNCQKSSNWILMIYIFFVGNLQLSHKKKARIVYQSQLSYTNIPQFWSTTSIRWCHYKNEEAFPHHLYKRWTQVIYLYIFSALNGNDQGSAEEEK